MRARSLGDGLAAVWAGVQEIGGPVVEFGAGYVVPGAAFPGAEVYLREAEIPAVMLAPRRAARCSARRRQRGRGLVTIGAGREAGGEDVGLGGEAVGEADVGAAVAETGRGRAGVTNQDQRHATRARMIASSVSCCVAPRQSPV